LEKILLNQIQVHHLRTVNQSHDHIHGHFHAVRLAWEAEGNAWVALMISQL